MSFSSLAAACIAIAAISGAPASALAAPPGQVAIDQEGGDQKGGDQKGGEQDTGVRVLKAWARASAGAATTGAAYVTLTGGNEADTLVGVSTPAAGTAQVHESIDDHGVMKMRPVVGVAVPAHRTVTFTPGGYHIMLMALKHPLAAGQSFPLTLQFAHAAPVTVDVKIEAMGHSATGGGHEGMKM